VNNVVYKALLQEYVEILACFNLVKHSGSKGASQRRHPTAVHGQEKASSSKTRGEPGGRREEEGSSGRGVEGGCAKDAEGSATASIALTVMSLALAPLPLLQRQTSLPDDAGSKQGIELELVVQDLEEEGDNLDAGPPYPPHAGPAYPPHTGPRSPPGS
jgi:hypothetical protein